MKQTIILSIILLLFTTTRATNYFVSAGGNNNNSGLSSAQAWATLQYAANKVVAGDSVFVSDGTYVGCYIEATGASAKPIVFKANGNNVVVNQPNNKTQDGINVENCKWIVIDGFRVINQPRAGIRVVESDNCVVRNNYCDANERWGIFTGFAENILIEYNECSNSRVEHGIYFSNSADNPVIRYNKSHHNSKCGIHMNGDIDMGGDGIISNARVEGNIIYENGATGGSGINCDGVVNSVIINNLLYENHASGISLFQIDGGGASTGNKIANNTIINASNARWCLNITDGSTGNVVFNNILINQHPSRGSISVSSNSLTGLACNNNILINRMSKDGDNTTISLAAWQISGYDGNSLLANNLSDIFLAPASGDYHLKANAQAIDKGSNIVSAYVTNDIENSSRPQGTAYDIGCYEYGVSNSVQEKNSKNSFMLFPNPATTTVVISAGRDTTLEIYNMVGDLLKSYSCLKGSNVIDVSDFSSGIYLVRSGNSCKRLVVQ